MGFVQVVNLARRLPEGREGVTIQMWAWFDVFCLSHPAIASGFFGSRFTLGG